MSCCAHCLCVQAVASRLGDTGKYPLLSEYKAIYSGSKDHLGYLDADPVSILKCLMDMPQHQGKLLHKEGNLDALAVVAAMTVQSALHLNQLVRLQLTSIVSFCYDDVSVQALMSHACVQRCCGQQVPWTVNCILISCLSECVLALVCLNTGVWFGPSLTMCFCRVQHPKSSPRC